MRAQASSAADHPRECGANWPRLEIGLRRGGSSPRVRGKLAHHVRREGTRRIIPASAGQTRRPSSCSPIREDHPRECGANVRRCRSSGCRTGSSPRVRGKLGEHLHRQTKERIIPASAGQTVRRGRCGQKLTDHPRECGANLIQPSGIVSSDGSSPRVRGKLADRGREILQERIIPASAGQTRPSARPWRHGSDHPRECGAN